MNSVSWKEKYPKNNKPKDSSLKEFWSTDVNNLFYEFSKIVADKYRMSITQWSYTSKYGWKLKGCIKSVEFIKNVIILDNGFLIDNIVVKNHNDISNVIKYISSLYTDDFIQKQKEHIEKRNKEQSERSKRRVEREVKELEEFMKQIEPSKLNKFKWEPKVPRNLLKKLYHDYMKMPGDSELLDDIGLRLYVRCLQGREERLLADQRKLKCHNCKLILSYSNNGLLVCDCGNGYIFREYMRSFNKNSMPSRSATPFFNEYIEKWQKAKDHKMKMQLIDWVIHQCHLNMLSGVTRHFAGCNLIEGTKKQVSELILSLAYD